jgi:hypothetical protein
VPSIAIAIAIEPAIQVISFPAPVNSAVYIPREFGSLLFFRDVLFGTAKITRRYPEKIGVENLPATMAAAQLWPLVPAARE